MRGRGLVIITGCGHAGVVNIIRHATRLTGVSKLLALVGGFHLGGPAFEPVIGSTVDALTELAPKLIVPGHCTGWRAQHTLAAALPDAWVQTSVGTTHTLSAPRRRVMPDPGSAVPAQTVQQEVQRRRYANGCRGYLGWHPERWKPAGSRVCGESGLWTRSAGSRPGEAGFAEPVRRAGEEAVQVAGSGWLARAGRREEVGETPSEGLEEDRAKALGIPGR